MTNASSFNPGRRVIGRGQLCFVRRCGGIWSGVSRTGSVQDRAGNLIRHQDLDAEDSGKLFAVTEAGDGDALTLPAIAAGLSGITILAVGAFGTTAVTIDPNAADMIMGPDITGADNKDLICTKATQRRGDFVTLIAGDADGMAVTEMRGTCGRAKLNLGVQS